MEKCSLSMATGTAGLFMRKHATPGTFGSSWMDCMCLGGHLRVQWPACRGHSHSPLESYTKTSPFQYFHQHSRLDSTWEEVQLRSCLRGLFSGGKKNQWVISLLTGTEAHKAFPFPLLCLWHLLTYTWQFNVAENVHRKIAARDREGG